MSARLSDLAFIFFTALRVQKFPRYWGEAWSHPVYPRHAAGVAEQVCARYDSSDDGGWFTLFLLVDSGAVTSALPKSDASAFGMDPEAGRAQAIVGIEGITIKGWEHIARIRLGDERLDIPLLFVDSDKAPRVLGREGMFDRFTIVFDEAKRRTGLLDLESPPAQAV
jgi:hypothetical protein